MFYLQEIQNMPDSKLSFSGSAFEFGGGNCILAHLGDGSDLWIISRPSNYNCRIY